MGKKGEWVELNKNILSYYQEKPKTTDVDIVINETDIEGIPIIKKEGILDSNNVEWYKVQGKKTHKDKKGWIKKNDLTEKNPYNWQEYGWQLKEDTGTQYFYQFGDLVQDSEPHQFIKDIWEQVDTDKDGVLSVRELQRAISKKEKAEVLSKLICKHPNEWNTWQNIASFKQEVEAIYQKGIELEEEPGQKQELETARDEKIALLEDKIEKLCFWDKIKDGDVATKPKEETKTKKPKRSFRPQEPEVKKENEGIKRTFPSDSSAIYHFHPIAFVKHMKLICGLDITTFFIYHDGKIEKHLSSSKEKKYKYVYVDDKGKHHEICTAEYTITKKKKYGVVHYSKPTHSTEIYDNNVSDGSTTRRVKYTNNDIAEYGKHPTLGLIWRLYEAKSEDVEIVKMPDSLNYSKDGTVIKYKFTSTKRRYTGPGVLAGFIGALAEHGIELKTTGSCFKEGSCFPSKKHVNGESVDTIYTWDKIKDQKIFNAMKKFHFEERLIGNNSYFANFDNTEDGGDLHDSHLHSGEFNNNKIEIIK